MGSNLRACSLCAEYLAPDADSTRDMIRDGVTSDFWHVISDQRDVGRMQKMTDLVARVDHYVGSAKEASDGGRMHMKQTLLRFGNAITTPVDLYELG